MKSPSAVLPLAVIFFDLRSLTEGFVPLPYRQATAVSPSILLHQSSNPIWDEAISDSRPFWEGCPAQQPQRKHASPLPTNPTLQRQQQQSQKQQQQQQQQQKARPFWEGCPTKQPQMRRNPPTNPVLQLQKEPQNQRQQHQQQKQQKQVLHMQQQLRQQQFQHQQQQRQEHTKKSIWRVPPHMWLEAETIRSIQHAPIGRKRVTQKIDDSRTLYEVLGASPTDTKAVLRQNYLLLAKQTHPDATSNGNAEAFAKIAEAWEILSDDRQRLRYDRSLRAQNFTNTVSNWFDRLAAKVVTAVDTALQQWLDRSSKVLPQHQQ